MARANGALGNRTFDTLAWSARTLGAISPLRRALARRMEMRLRAPADHPAPDLRHPPAIEEDKAALALALLQMAERALAERRLGRPALRALIKTLLADVLVHRGDATAKQRFRARHGCGAPDFLAISPGKACNLRCEGCYANSGEHGEKLAFATVDRLVRDAHDDWGSRFFVLTGGEPFAWRESGLGVLDLAERHSDCFFIAYTNGTDVLAAAMPRGPGSPKPPTEEPAAASVEPDQTGPAGGHRPRAELLARTFAVDVLACLSATGG